jgi:hypothetical protein
VEAADGRVVDEDVAVGVPAHRHRQVLLLRCCGVPVSAGQLRRGRVEEDVLDDDPAPGRRDQGGVAVSVDRGRRVARHLSLRGAEGEGIGSRLIQFFRRVQLHIFIYKIRTYSCPVEMSTSSGI